MTDLISYWFRPEKPLTKCTKFKKLKDYPYKTVQYTSFYAHIRCRLKIYRELGGSGGVKFGGLPGGRKFGGGLGGGVSGGLPGFQGTSFRMYFFNSSSYPEKNRLIIG